MYVTLHNIACAFKIQSVQFSNSVVSDSLWPHGLQHARPPCPSPIRGVYSDSCQLNRWCHPTISSSVVPFSSCPQSFPSSGFFLMSHLFASRVQSIGVSASTSVFPMNIRDWFPLGWTGWLSQSKGLNNWAKIRERKKIYMQMVRHQTSLPFKIIVKSLALFRELESWQVFLLLVQSCFHYSLTCTNRLVRVKFSNICESA